MSGFYLYSDCYSEINRQMNLKYQFPSIRRILIANLKKTQLDESQRLPVPATYIINGEGIVVWRHFNPDYRKRSTVYEIMQVLTEIK